MLRPIVALLLVAVSCSGCATWRPVSEDGLQDALANGTTSQVRVTVQDGTLVLKRARVADNAIVGIPDHPPGSTPVSIAFKDVQRFEVRGPN